MTDTHIQVNDINLQATQDSKQKSNTTRALSSDIVSCQLTVVLCGIRQLVNVKRRDGDEGLAFSAGQAKQ